MVGLVHLVVFSKDALLAAALVFQFGNFGRDTFQLDIGLADKAPHAIGCVRRGYVKEHSSGVAPREMRWGNFRAP